MKSKLAKVTILSPNCYTTRIDYSRASIHCMAGNLTIEQCGNIFKNPKREASSNYGIGSDGRIANYVPEEKGSWCTSNKDNDMRAITIEVANDGGAETGWHASDKAVDALVNLLIDICTRHKKKRLVWLNDKAKSLAYKPKDDEMMLTVHRWFAAKACPGDYLYNKHPEIVKRVNEALNGYKVKVKPTNLKVRKQPSKTADVVTLIHKDEIYTIVEERKNEYNWGRLKSGIGWVNLNYVKRL